MLKSIFRSELVQTVLGLVAAAYWRLISLTSRWTIEGEEIFRDCWESDRGFIAACWHSRIALMPVITVKLAKGWAPPPEKTGMIISMSRDGGFVAKGAEHIHLTPIRGSAKNKKKLDKDKGGVQALIEANKKLKAGACVCLTPDGPRGPREHVSEGTIKIAQRAGVPIVIVGAAAAPAHRLKTWDRFITPGLFGRAVMIFEGPMECPKGADVETLRAELERRMRDANDRAEAMVGMTPTPRPAPKPDTDPDTDIVGAAE